MHASLAAPNVWLGLFFEVIAPLLRPAIATVAVFTIVPIWNDLWFPLILTSSDSTHTITLGVQQFLGQYITDWNSVLAALSMAILPVVVIYVIFSRQLISGLTAVSRTLAPGPDWTLPATEWALLLGTSITMGSSMSMFRSLAAAGFSAIKVTARSRISPTTQECSCLAGEPPQRFLTMIGMAGWIWWSFNTSTTTLPATADRPMGNAITAILAIFPVPPYTCFTIAVAIRLAAGRVSKM